MTVLYEAPTAETAELRPQGRVLKGQYAGMLRSKKGKIKGLQLRSQSGDYAVKLPKYLRPVLVREFTPDEYVQVWAYPDEAGWRAVNVLPLPETEAAELAQAIATAPVAPSPPAPAAPKSEVCIQVCGKGKCCKQGSRQLAQALQAEVAANPALQHVSVETTGCMKACKQGPNLRVEGKQINRVSPHEAIALLAKYQ